MTVYTATPQAPPDLSSSPVPRPQSEVTFDTDDGSGGDLDWEWDTTAAFTNADGLKQTLTTTGHTDGQLVAAQPPSNLTQRMWWWRARATSSGGGVAGSWSTARRITYRAVVGTAHMGVWENVGLDVQHSGEGYHGLWQNVGFDIDHSGEAYMGTWENVSFTLVNSGDAFMGTWYGDVDTSFPIPHIWFLRPTSGREGDGFSIYGHGFGANNAMYDGHAYLGHQEDWDGAEEIDAAYQLSETAWQWIAGGPDAFTSAREINPLVGEPTMEHGRIDVVVYVDAESGIVVVQTDDGA